TGATISNLSTGWYTVHVTDANGCKADRKTYVNYNPNNNSCYCTITGTVFVDGNNNCIQDNNEVGVPNIQVKCSGGYGTKFTDANGKYSFEVVSGTYTVSEVVQHMYPLALCQNNNQTVNATAGTNCTH